MQLSRRTCLAMGMAVTLSACFGSASPFSVVEDFYAAVAKGKTEEATGHLALEQVSANEMQMVQAKVKMLVTQGQSMTEANGGLDGITLLKEEISEDGESARVRVEVKFNNGKSKEESFRLLKQDGDWKIRL